MSRGTGSGVTTPFRSTASAVPVWLVRIATGRTSPTYLRYHDAGQMEAITFDGESYVAANPTVPEQKIEASSENGSLSLRVPDEAGTIAGYVIGGTSFSGQRVRLILTDRSVIDAAGTAALSGTYFIDSVACEEGSVVFGMKPLFGMFSMEVPIKTLTRAEFPGLAPRN